MNSFLQEIPKDYYGFIFHYYRAEVYRETNWRNRLDTTTNWAIVTTAGMASFAFANAAATHVVLLFNVFVVFFFLFIESRRFRNYSMLRERTRIIEKELLAPLFGSMAENTADLRKLGESLAVLRTKMGRVESIAWRLRRNYVFLFFSIYILWLLKVRGFPVVIGEWGRFFENARVLFLPGEVVFAIFTSFIVYACVLAYVVPKESNGGNDLP